MKADVNTLTDAEREWVIKATQRFRFLRPGGAQLIERPMRDAKGVLVEVHYFWADSPDMRVGRAVLTSDGRVAVDAY